MRDPRRPPRFDSILPSSELLCGLRWFETDVSGLPVGPIFKGSSSLRRTAWPLKMGKTRNTETSVSNHITPRNNRMRKNSYVCSLQSINHNPPLEGDSGFESDVEVARRVKISVALRLMKDFPNFPLPYEQKPVTSPCSRFCAITYYCSHTFITQLKKL